MFWSKMVEIELDTILAKSIARDPSIHIISIMHDYTMNKTEITYTPGANINMQDVHQHIDNIGVIFRKIAKMKDVVFKYNYETNKIKISTEGIYLNFIESL